MVTPTASGPGTESFIIPRLSKLALANATRNDPARMAFFDDHLQDVKALRLVRVRAAGGRVRQDLPDRRGTVRIVRRKFRDGIVERNAVFLHAPQNQRGGEGLRQAVGVKRCIRARGHQPIHVLMAEHPFVGNVSGTDDQQRHSGDADLLAQRFDVVAEARQNQVVGSAQRHTDDERGGELRRELDGA